MKALWVIITAVLSAGLIVATAPDKSAEDYPEEGEIFDMVRGTSWAFRKDLSDRMEDSYMIALENGFMTPNDYLYITF